MSAPARNTDVRCDEPATRLAALERATARRRRLEGLFEDAPFMRSVLSDGRYLRLCAAVAWASEREEKARAALETDLMVDRLRAAMAGRSPQP